MNYPINSIEVVKSIHAEFYKAEPTRLYLGCRPYRLLMLEIRGGLANPNSTREDFTHFEGMEVFEVISHVDHIGVA